jgi:hypothetical protein
LNVSQEPSPQQSAQQVVTFSPGVQHPSPHTSGQSASHVQAVSKPASQMPLPQEVQLPASQYSGGVHPQSSGQFSQFSKQIGSQYPSGQPGATIPQTVSASSQQSPESKQHGSQ